MVEFLMREQAPLSASQWEVIDRTVEETARRLLVGRRIIPVYGPVSVGLQAIPADMLPNIDGGVVSLIDRESAVVSPVVPRQFLPLPIIYRDFVLHWRDIEASRQFSIPLDASAAAVAAAFVAQKEDDLIFNGSADLRLPGLRTVENRTTIPMRDWSAMGNGFADVRDAIQRLIAAGFPGPYAVVLSPVLYAHINRVYENTGVLEIEQIQKLALAGVFQTPVVPEPTALVISVGAENMDLVIAQDLVTAFLQVENLNSYFRVLEILTLRIKRPGAVCTVGG